MTPAERADAMLVKCPTCPKTLRPTVMHGTWTIVSRWFFVSCPCGWRSPQRKSELGAAKAWNKLMRRVQ